MNIYEELKISPDSGEALVKQKYWQTLETYQLVFGSSENDQIKTLAQMKIDKLKMLGKEKGYPDTPAYHPKSKEQIHQLDKNGGLEDSEEILFKAKLLCWGNDQSYADLDKINKLLDTARESGEKYYLKAVVTLRIDNYSILGCRNAVTMLEQALRYDGLNELYLGLFNAVKREIEIYNDKVENDRRAEEERQRRLEEDIEIKKRNDMIGNVIGVSVAVLAGIGMCCCCQKCCSGGCC